MLPTVTPRQSLATMTLAEAPDYATAIAAAEAHGIVGRHALRSAFGKLVTDNKALFERYELAHFTEGEDNHAMFDWTSMTQLLLVALADLGPRIKALETENVELRKLLTSGGL